MGSILGWLWSAFGGMFLRAGLALLESKFPMLTPIVNQILAWLGQGVPASQVVAHLNQADFSSPQGKV